VNPDHLFYNEGNTVGSLPGTQHALIIGALLGDGAMRCKANALLEINHCLEQQVYVDWKYQQLSDLVGTPPKARAGNGSRLAYRFTTLSLPQLTPYYRVFYCGGTKVVPDIELEPLSLAVWFMDDGCKTHRALYLNTQQFSVEDQLRLIGMLKQQLGIDSALNRDKHYYRIRISVGSVSRFKEIVSSHMLEQFAYKFPEMTP
jgi:recombination protein RecA